jgi:hypothetical protein
MLDRYPSGVGLSAQLFSILVPVITLSSLGARTKIFSIDVFRHSIDA